MKAQAKGRLPRQKYELKGSVDMQELADRMGLQIDLWHLPAADVHEITVGRSVGVSSELEGLERRWAIAHGIGHLVLHPGNHVWLRAHTMLAIPYEREAEAFAYGLLVDEAEAVSELLSTPGEVAEHFGVPVHTLWENAPDAWVQARLF